MHADGDGTVLLTGALGDSFPDSCSQRVIVQNLSHFPMLMDQRVWTLLGAFLNE